MRKVKYLLLGAIVMVVMGLTGCSSNEVNLTDYVSVKFTGVDGQGKATCNVNTAGLEQALAGDNDGEISLEEFKKLGWITQFEMGLTYDLDKDSKLSNGDIVTVTMKYNEKLAKDNKVKVTGDKKEFKVEGLKEVIEVDAFAKDIFDTDTGVVLEYKGGAPTASLSIKNKCTSEPESRITYKADKVSDISNGDKIKITAELPSSVANKGYVLKEAEKTITVEGLDTRVTNLSQLNEADRKEIENKLQDFFKASAANRIEFHSRDKVNKTLWGDTSSTYIYNNLTFLNDEYKIKHKDLTVIPFTVDIEMKNLGWWERPMDGVTEKTFNNAYGYITISNLTMDSNGNVNMNTELKMDMGEIYETKDALETKILGNYGL